MKRSTLGFAIVLVACGSDPDGSALRATTAASTPPTQFCGGQLPDPMLTPGSLCTASDPNFVEYRYKEHIPYCKRDVPTTERDKVSLSYGVPVADLANYEMDHFLPLSVGGSDDATNLWPQPHTLALEKDKVEQEVFDGMNAGTMTQAEAVAKIRAWRSSTFPQAGCAATQ
jgi:hypothetical protein